MPTGGDHTKYVPKLREKPLPTDKQLDAIRKANEEKKDRREYNNPRPKGDSDNARQW